jgi:hypothetical protein
MHQDLLEQLSNFMAIGGIDACSASELPMLGQDDGQQINPITTFYQS